MTKKILYLLLFSLIIYSCKKEEQKIKTVDQTIEVATQNLPKDPPIYLPSSAPENEIITHIKKRQQVLSLLLKSVAPEKADELYKNLIKENDSALTLLQIRKETLLEKYYGYSDYDPQTQVYTMKFPKEVEKLVKDYRAAGIEFWEIGEGYTELRMLPTYYFKLFAGKFSPDYQTYLEMITAEDQVLFQSDAAIRISWRDVAKRVESREKFLIDFPNSKLIKEIKQQLKEYQYAYLLGYDNTQTHEQGKLNPENLEEFKRIIRENPNSETSTIIKELLPNDFDRDGIFDFVTKRIGYNLYE
ncbi:hypothetical protein [Kaistella antarctica]|nr:hypothetical protein [Kaistella antarctica]SEV98232.1 hypothetical protein SAMN05421765_1674 [Kaistella antarctica]VEH96589.1 Uncharacterised protein [Kaistella antarctica]